MAKAEKAEKVAKEAKEAKVEKVLALVEMVLMSSEQYLPICTMSCGAQSSLSRKR